MNSAQQGLLSGILILASSLTHAQSVTLAPVSPHPQVSVTVTGAHFADSEAIDVYFDTVDTLLLVSTSTGTFTGTVMVPAAAAPGKHYITAIGRRSGDAAQGALTVTTPWAEFGYGSAHLGWNPYENTVSADNVAQLGVLWSVPVNGTGGTPAISGGKAFVGTNAGITALSTATGAVLWTEETSDEFDASPAVVAGVVYAVGYSGTVYALAASNGAQKWSFVLPGGASQSAPVVVAGIVYVSDLGGTVYAVQASTGQFQWSNSVCVSGSGSSPTVANGTLYIGCDDGNLIALDALTGSLRWIYTTGGSIDGSPVVSGGFVYVGSEDGYVYSIHAAGAYVGIPEWKYNTEAIIYYPPAVAYGNVYIGSEVSLYALDAKFGTLTWSVDEDYFETPAVANGVVYVAGPGDTLHAFDANNGGLLGLWDTGTAYGSAISDGVVYVNGAIGNATALSLLGGTSAVRPEARAPEISTLHPDLTLEVTPR